MADNLERQRDSALFDVDTLNEKYASSGSRRLLEAVIDEYPDKRIALVSSFGANSVVLLHLVANIDPSIPVLFIDTGKIFGDTTTYRDEIAKSLGLTNIRIISPQQNVLKAVDPHGALWMSGRDTCCSIRKVQPFAQALKDYDIWISGRKRFQNGQRAELPLFELDGARMKINPLANWTKGDIDIYRNAFSLKQHPLVAKGYRSIGCEPCTTPVLGDEDERAGRWRGMDKTECGIHVPADTGGLP
ncbi:MAG: phosphoadenylyl-sulfate reductase [Pseudomonadota bacterium]